MNRFLATNENPGDDISDSSDWLSTLTPELKELEQAFRCYICKDFVKAPMMTACCSRTFCSLCIRRQFTADSRCPMCLKHGSESQLRKNRELEMAIDAWTKVRPKLMGHLTAKSAPEVSTVETVDKEVQVESTRQSNDDTSRSDSSSNTDSTQAIPEGMAQCPVCQKLFKVDHIERVHLAQCLSGMAPEPAQPTRKPVSPPSHTRCPSSSLSPQPAFSITHSEPARRATAPPLKKLPKPGLANLKLPALKARVAKLGISTKGSVQELLRREAEWINIWNANCDALRPAPTRTLHQELNRWEAQTQAAAVSSVTNEEVNGARGKQHGTVEEARAYSKKENDTFKALAKKARASARKKRKLGDTETDGGAGGVDTKRANNQQDLSPTPVAQEKETDGPDEIEFIRMDHPAQFTQQQTQGRNSPMLAKSEPSTSPVNNASNTAVES